MNIDFDRIIENEIGITSGSNLTPMDKGECKACMREACKTVLDEAIKSFPSHEHPEITKSILKIKEEL